MQIGFLSTAIRFNGPDPYLRQNLFELKGNIRPDLLKAAWQGVVDNEPMLRTGFIWENVGRPLQFILSNLLIDWHEYDWKGPSQHILDSKIQELLNLDYKASFDLHEPPLVRFNLIKLEADHYLLLWSIHHILVDGWCSSILIKKFITAYEQLNMNQKIDLPRSQLYRKYIEWVEAQDLKEAETFWKGMLDGAKATKLSTKNLRSMHSDCQYDHFHLELSEEKTELLRSLANKTKMTFSTLIQAAWAILINKYTNQSDFCFGVTVSGRSNGLSHIDTMIGLCINTLPLRISILPENDIMDILHQISKKMIQIQQYAYVSLAKISSWVGLGAGNFLFDHVFIFENYPVEQKAKEGGADMSITCIPSLSSETPAMNEQTEFPLILGITPLDKLKLSMSYRQDSFTKSEIVQLANHFAYILDEFLQRTMNDI